MTSQTPMQRAESARREGRPEVATRLLLELTAAQPDHAGAHNLLGMIALERGDTAGAIAGFSRATAADPEAAPLWMNLAKAQREAGDITGERSSLLQALRIDQRHFMALLRLAELHEREGDAAAASQRWHHVLAVARMMPERPAELAGVLAHGAAFVARQQTAFADEIDSAIGERRQVLDARDRRRFDACIDAMHGRRGIYANQCAGLHYPFLPADEFFDRTHFPWFGELERCTGAIRGELQSLLSDGAPGFAPYVARGPGAPVNKWTALDNSADWSAYHLWRHGAPVTAACARCPATAAALSMIPQAILPHRAPTAFFSLLKPHTRIPPHTGVSNVRSIVHLPLIVPAECGFRVGGETREWVEGQAFAFDDTIEHEAWNDSDHLRAVLIIDVWNPHLTAAERDMVGAFFEAADRSGHNPGTIGDIVD